MLSNFFKTKSKSSNAKCNTSDSHHHRYTNAFDTLLKLVERNDPQIALVSLRNVEIGDELSPPRKGGWRRQQRQAPNTTTSIGPDGAANIARAIAKNTHVTMLDLSDCSIGDEGVASLAIAFAFNRTVTEIDLSGNDIGPRGVSALSSALAVNHSIVSINLSRNNVCDDGASLLASVLHKQSAIRSLVLDGADIGDVGASHLAAALETNNGLRELVLRRNRIGRVGSDQIALAIDKNSVLTSLDLSENDVPLELVAKIATKMALKGRTKTTTEAAVAGGLPRRQHRANSMLIPRSASEAPPLSPDTRRRSLVQDAIYSRLGNSATEEEEIDYWEFLASAVEMSAASGGSRRDHPLHNGRKSSSSSLLLLSNSELHNHPFTVFPRQA